MEKTIGIYCPNFKRPKVLELWLASIERIRYESNIYISACVISEEVDKDLCGRYHVTHITHPNVPITEKFNKGIEWVKNMGLDYALVSGSDNIFSTDTIKRYYEEIAKGYDLIGVNQIYFYASDGLHRGKLVKFHTKYDRLLGVGKCISRRVLEAVDWKPWNKPKNWGMDAIASQNIMPHVKAISVLEDAKIFDVKSKTNINSIRIWIDKVKMLADPLEFYKILSDKEKEILFSIL